MHPTAAHRPLRFEHRLRSVSERGYRWTTLGGRPLGASGAIRCPGRTTRSWMTFDVRFSDRWRREPAMDGNPSETDGFAAYATNHRPRRAACTAEVALRCEPETRFGRRRGVRRAGDGWLHGRCPRLGGVAHGSASRRNRATRAERSRGGPTIGRPSRCAADAASPDGEARRLGADSVGLRFGRGAHRPSSPPEVLLGRRGRSGSAGSSRRVGRRCWRPGATPMSTPAMETRESARGRDLG